MLPYTVKKGGSLDTGLGLQLIVDDVLQHIHHLEAQRKTHGKRKE